MEEACVSVDNLSSHHKLPAKQLSAPSEWQLHSNFARFLLLLS